MLHPEKAPDVGVRERLVRLQQLEVTVAYPFVLPVYGEFARGEITSGQIAGVLDVVETFVVRRFVCAVPTNGLNKVFPPLYQQVKKQPELVEGIKTILAERNCPRDDAFRDRLDSAQLYGPGDRGKKTLLILSRLEAGLGHKEQVAASALSIEHVMPQTPTDWWKAHLGDDWEETHDQLLHTLGNLTLTKYNSELSNRPYPEKRAMLASSHFELNRYFAEVEHWNEGEIQRRADALTDLALTVWPYFGPARVEPVSEAGAPRGASDDVTSTLPMAVVFRGQRLPVRSWREVLVVTMEQIIAVAPDEFAALAKQLGRGLSRDPTSFGRTKRVIPLSNGAYLGTNQSASSIYRTCLQALQAVGIGPDEWQVERVSLAAGAEDADDEPSETRQLQLDFWVQVRAALDTTAAFTSLQAPRPR
ncbi:MAG: HNH endonuclease family protein [Deltaproteobacteria bacterium]|nr:HNH endonuclease family protein [Deltaproteobacteria bacterium]